MHKNIIKVRKSDDFRAILTDVLPYEVPLLFSNDGLYDFLQRHSAEIFKEMFGITVLANLGYTVPYTYKIKKNPTEYRSLSVMHPAQQIAVADFYKTYSGMILAQCQKSHWTLRAPTSVASYYVEKARAKRDSTGRTSSVEMSGSGFDTVSRTASSYFTYKKYSLLYKFFESGEFRNLEKRFGLLLKLDISQCFGKIYTHTISWAVKSKEYAKRNLRSKANTFEDNFDRLMQNSNYSETAGIIVGPEVSRIFAEIILQQIDKDIEQALTNRSKPLICGRDYDIRRYVDDYFIFANSEEVLTAVQLSISECLTPYKLSLNEAKSTRTSRPFSTAETSARIEVASKISEFFDRAMSFDLVEDPAGSTPKKIYRPTRTSSPDHLANTTIRDIKRAIKARDTVFDTTSNYFFGTVKRLVIRYVTRIAPEKLEPLQAEWSTNFLLALIEVLFFFYASSPRVRQTYLLSEILLLTVKYCENLPQSQSERIFTKVSQEIKLATQLGAENVPEDNIETLNLLLVLQHLGPQYGMEPIQLSIALGIDSGPNGMIIPSSFGYFQMVTSLYLIGDEARYKNLRDCIVQHISKLFIKDPEWQNKSELVMLLLDMTTCPYLTDNEKVDLVKACLRHQSSKDLKARANAFLALTGTRHWFLNWSKEIRLADILQKKELRTPY